MLAELSGKLLEVEPGPFSAAKEAFTVLMIRAIGAGLLTPAEIAGAETVASEAGDKVTDDLVCRSISGCKVLLSKLGDKLLLFWTAVIIQAEQENRTTKWHGNSKLLQNTLRRTATAYTIHKVFLLEALGQYCFEVNFA